MVRAVAMRAYPEQHSRRNISSRSAQCSRVATHTIKVSSSGCTQWSLNYVQRYLFSQFARRLHVQQASPRPTPSSHAARVPLPP